MTNTTCAFIVEEKLPSFMHKEAERESIMCERRKREKCIEWKRKRRERAPAHGSSPAAARAAREMRVE